MAANQKGCNQNGCNQDTPDITIATKFNKTETLIIENGSTANKSSAPTN